MEGIQNEGASLQITGETRVYVVIGDPIAQVKSTHLYNKLTAETQADVVFIPMQFSAKNSNVLSMRYERLKILPTSSQRYRTSRE
jgi:shikimate 5-dehydrogenase